MKINYQKFQTTEYPDHSPIAFNNYTGSQFNRHTYPFLHDGKFGAGRYGAG